MTDYWEEAFSRGYWDAALGASYTMARSSTGEYGAGYRAGQAWRTDGVRPYGVRFWYPAWPGGLGSMFAAGRKHFLGE